MESFFTVLLFILVLLFYFSNRNNKVNKWCAMAGFIFWLGVAKEAFLFNLVPYLKTIWGYTIPHAYYDGAYSSMTWALYSLAMPTTVIFSAYFCNMDNTNSERMRKLKVLIYAPALLLSFLFTPLTFRAYQLNSLPFWIIYSTYNFIFVIACVFFLSKGVRSEKPGKARTQKKLVRIIVLPPVLYWFITVFPIHTLGLGKFMKLWQGNVLILSVCVLTYIIMAFRDGTMGLRLKGESYQWNSDLGLINKGAEYTSHMLKNQTAKMEWCIENLKAQFDHSDNKTPEELAILSRSISTLKSYTDTMKKHSETITLLEETCSLKTLLESALPPSHATVSIQISAQDDIFVLCDKTHMSEVFVNVISNAIEATHDPKMIEIGGKYDNAGRFYCLRFTDNGIGMSADDVKNMFMPYFTTKNTGKNFGLGLAYCKNVVEKHGGHINAESELGKGTTVTIEFPVKRITVGEAGRK